LTPLITTAASEVLAARNSSGPVGAGVARLLAARALGGHNFITFVFVCRALGCSRGLIVV